MPYFIAKNRATCKDGWAVIDQAGAIFGCHANKQDAIDQAIAISLSDKEPFMGERAAEGELQPGDYVQWIDGQDAMFGEVLSIDGIDVTVQIYEEQDGVWVQSVLTQVVALGDLTKIADLPTNEGQDVPDSVDQMRKADGAPVILSDIDGTLLNGGNRNDRVWEFIQSLDGSLFILTGRPESERSQTERDLAQADITYSRLIMNDGSTADSPSFKKAKAEELLKTYDIVAAIENNDTTLRYFRELGIDAYSPGSIRASALADSLISRIEPKVDGVEAVDVRDKWLGVANRLKARIEGGKVEGRSSSNREQRVQITDFEVRETPAGMTFEGYAALFNTDSQPLPFIERIAPGAFKRSLQSRNEVKLLWNHDAGEPLASVRGGTLKLIEDARGLRVEATLANTTRGRDVAELIRSKTIDSMSFGFSVIKDSWSGDVRTLEAVRLFEVSVVSFPAYEATAGTVSVRSVGIDADSLATALMRLESGEDLQPADAALINDVVAKLTVTEEVQAVEGDILALKKKKLDLLLKEI